MKCAYCGQWDVINGKCTRCGNEAMTGTYVPGAYVEGPWPVPPPRPKPVADARAQVLDGAKACVLANRNVEYGEPEDNFQRIADLWTAWLWSRGLLPRTQRLMRHDVAIMCGQIKEARIAESPEKLDHWVDLAGYAACGYKVATNSQQGTLRPRST